MSQVNMKIALIISFLFSGLGIAYAGDLKKGVGIFAATVLLNIMGLTVHPLLSRVSIIVWIAGLYLTYRQVQAVNGE